MADIKAFIEQVKNMTVIELSDIVKALEEEFGVSAAAPVAVAAAGGAPAAAAAPVEEQTEFTVVLKNFGGNKLAVIKAIREITELSLPDSKALVESAPSNVKEAVAKDVAETVATKLKAAGAEVEIK